MHFSVLIGADNVARFDQWKEYEQILAFYPIFVYPRSGYSVEKFADRMTYLEGAPLFDFSATDVREAFAAGKPIDAMVCPEVEKYIKSNKLW